MKTAVVIFGPQGTGKTLHARALARHYGKTKIADGGLYDLRWNKPFPANYLVLSYDEATARDHTEQFGTTIVSIIDARRAAGI